MGVNKKTYNDHMQERGQYAIVPNEIWERADLDHTAKTIWCYILSRKADWRSSRNNISRNLNMHHETVTKYVAQLESLNLLKKTPGAGKSWDFKIIPPDQWLPERTDPKTDQSAQHTSGDTSSRPQVVHPADHTQESILTIRTSSASSVCSVNSSSKEENKFPLPSHEDSPPENVRSGAEPKSTLPDYAVKASPWYQHYLKSPINEGVFNSLPEEVKSALHAKTLKLAAGTKMKNGRISDATDAKDQFVAALEEHRQKSNPDKVTNLDDIKIEL